MDGHISAPATDVVRGVLVQLVPIALVPVTVHSLHAQLLHPLSEGESRLVFLQEGQDCKYLDSKLMLTAMTPSISWLSRPRVRDLLARLRTAVMTYTSAARSWMRAR